MRILVLEAAARDQGSCFAQCTDDRVVGVALLAVVGDDALAREARRILGVEAVGIHREGDGVRDALALDVGLAGNPDVVVIRAMAGCGVDEARAGIVRHVIAVEHRHGEIITEVSERVTEDHARRVSIAEALEAFDLGGLHHLFGKAIGEDVGVTGPDPVAFGRGLHFIEAIADLRREADGAVAGDGPGRGCPDDHGGTEQLARRRFAHRELHEDRVGLVVLVFDLGLGKRGLLDH